MLFLCVIVNGLKYSVADEKVILSAFVKVHFFPLSFSLQATATCFCKIHSTLDTAGMFG